MSPLEFFGMLAAIMVSIGTILSMFALGVKWLVKHYFDDIKAELKPNGGSSIKDQITKLEKDQSQLNGKIDYITKILLDHISKFNK